MSEKIENYVVIRNVLIPLVWSKELETHINELMQKNKSSAFVYKESNGKKLTLTPDAKNLWWVKTKFDTNLINEGDFIRFYAACIVKAIRDS